MPSVTPGIKYAFVFLLLSLILREISANDINIKPIPITSELNGNSLNKKFPSYENKKITKSIAKIKRLPISFIQVKSILKKTAHIMKFMSMILKENGALSFSSQIAGTWKMLIPMDQTLAIQN